MTNFCLPMEKSNKINSAKVKYENPPSFENMSVLYIRTCSSYFCITVTKTPGRRSLREERLFWLLVSEGPIYSCLATWAWAEHHGSRRMWGRSWQRLRLEPRVDVTFKCSFLGIWPTSISWDLPPPSLHSLLKLHYHLESKHSKHKLMGDISDVNTTRIKAVASTPDDLSWIQTQQLR